jgi:hypothetical protein
MKTHVLSVAMMAEMCFPGGDLIQATGMEMIWRGGHYSLQIETHAAAKRWWVGDDD